MACDAILKFGGDRNRRKGAYPFLHGLTSPSGYLSAAARQLSLATADLTVLGNVAKMNSMLTKVHALAATDGLPIYDSRVAAAVATLVEIYRSCKSPGWQSVPPLLMFPSLDLARDVTTLFRGAMSHGSLASRTASTTVPWTRAKIRLGWLMEEVLKRQPALIPASAPRGSSVSARMHAFEAALFMIGYDARCLARNFCHQPAGGVIISERSRAKAIHEKKKQKVSSRGKVVSTLARHNAFRYFGTRESGVSIETGGPSLIYVSKPFVDEMVEHFADSGWINGDFSRGPTGKGRMPDGSLGHFIERHSEASLGVRLTRQHARIAAVLVDLGVCQFRKQGRALQFNFDPTAA